jgi:FtsP/CotA-like multicopper oxidase with cupredoxin domain
MKDMGMAAWPAWIMGAHGGGDSGMNHGDMNHGSMNGGPGAMSHDMRDKSKLPPNVKVGVGGRHDRAQPRRSNRGSRARASRMSGTRCSPTATSSRSTPNPDKARTDRTSRCTSPGNMERFMWVDRRREVQREPGADPLRAERAGAVTMVNDSMMTHPMHLHGHFFEVVNGHGGHQPMKHTVMVLPGGKVSFDLTADAPATGRSTATCSTTCMPG